MGAGFLFPVFCLTGNSNNLTFEKGILPMKTMEIFSLSKDDRKLENTPDLSSVKTVIFTCKCRVRTSGIFKNVATDQRFCPGCGRLLVVCGSEGRKHWTSVSERNDALVCDCCGKVVSAMRLPLDMHYQRY